MSNGSEWDGALSVGDLRRRAIMEKVNAARRKAIIAQLQSNLKDASYAFAVTRAPIDRFVNRIADLAPGFEEELVTYRDLAPEFYAQSLVVLVDTQARTLSLAALTGNGGVDMRERVGRNYFDNLTLPSIVVARYVVVRKETLEYFGVASPPETPSLYLSFKDTGKSNPRDSFTTGEPIFLPPFMVCSSN